jgi:hypothetical protein
VVQKTPRAASLRRENSGSGGDTVSDQNQTPGAASLSPRESEDGCINLDESTMENAEGESVQV